MNEVNYTYRHDGEILTSCRLYIREGNPNLVVATETGSTWIDAEPHMAERLAEGLYNRLGCPERFVWLEQIETVGPRPRTTFNIVEFETDCDEFTGFRRIPIRRSQAEKLAGRAL